MQPRDWHSNVPTDPLDFKAMYEALSADTSVTRFHIEEVKLTDQAAVALAAALTSNSTLRKLDLNGNDVSDAAMVSLCSGLAPPSACHLTRIRLNGGHIRNAGAVAFAAVLRTNTSMIEVDISNNYIGSVGAPALASAVSSNRTLIKLNLRLNEIDDDGGIAFANALALNDCALEELNLGAQMRVDGFAGWGLLGNQFAEAMGAALHTNTALKVLKISRSRIGHAGAKHIAEGLRGNSTLTRLQLSDNPLGPQGNLYIAQALKDCAISILDFTSTYGRDEGAVFFAEALMHADCTLTSLSLSECNITADGAADLATGLAANTSLKLLDLRMNPLQNSGLEALSTVLTDRNSTLEVLVLSDEPEDTHGEGITRDLRYLNRAMASRALPLQLRIRNRVTFVNENGLLTGDPYPSTATDYGELVLEGMQWWARCNKEAV